MNASYRELARTFDVAKTTLELTDEWNAIQESERIKIQQQLDLTLSDPPSVSTTTELLSALQSEPLLALRNRLDSIPGRFEKARSLAAQRLEPKVVQVQIDKPMLKTKTRTSITGWRGREQIATTILGGNPAKVV